MPKRAIPQAVHSYALFILTSIRQEKSPQWTLYTVGCHLSVMPSSFQFAVSFGQRSLYITSTSDSKRTFFQPSSFTSTLFDQRLSPRRRQRRRRTHDIYARPSGHWDTDWEDERYNAQFFFSSLPHSPLTSSMPSVVRSLFADSQLLRSVLLGTVTRTRSSFVRYYSHIPTAPARARLPSTSVVAAAVASDLRRLRRGATTNRSFSASLFLFLLPSFLPSFLSFFRLLSRVVVVDCTHCAELERASERAAV